jgi:hypothetical protein
MTPQSPHRRWKGCPICKPYKQRGVGAAYRKPLPELRKLGKLRRVRRHDLGDALDA